MGDGARRGRSWAVVARRGLTLGLEIVGSPPMLSTEVAGVFIGGEGARGGDTLLGYDDMIKE
jgi:hypothetical protein